MRRDERGREAPPIGILCGGGSIPLAVAKAVQARGRGVMLFPFYGFADAAVERFPHRWLHLGAVGTLLAAMREAGCKEIVMIGSLVRPRPWNVRFDFTTVLLLPRLLPLFRGGDDRLLKGVAEIFEEHGFHLAGAHEVAPEILMPAGPAGKHRPRAAEADDIRLGFALLRAIGPFDVGQAAAIANLHVIAVEAAEGTAAMLSRIAEMRANGRLKLPARAGVLVKAPKPGQDRRFDLPAIGPDTVAQAKAAGLAGIAVEAGSTVVADPAGLARAADKAGLFVVGVRAQGKRTRG
ncbi:MAG: UDP-2,3-diacylglucosamine diphosphatase LpxI [Xanthobacteraceae bacterium]